MSHDPFYPGWNGRRAVLGLVAFLLFIVAVFALLILVQGCATAAGPAPGDPRFQAGFRPPAVQTSGRLSRAGPMPLATVAGGEVCISNRLTGVHCYPVITNAPPLGLVTNYNAVAFQYPPHPCNWWIQSSPDLRTWTDLCAFTNGGGAPLNGGSLIHWTDQTTNAATFYRERVQWL